MPHPHHPLIAHALAGRQRLLAHEQRLVAQVKASYSAARVLLEPHVNAFMHAYSSELERRTASVSNTGETGERVTVPSTWLLSRQGGNVHALQQAIRTHISRFASEATAHTSQAQQSAVSDATQQARQALHTALTPLQHAAPQFSSQDVVKVARHEAIQALVGNASNGTPLRNLFDRVGDTIADAVYQDLITAIGLGYGPRQVASWLWQDIGGAQSQALNIARTELLGAWRQATSLNYQANSDMLDGWIWLCALSPHSCGMCVAMNGTEHTVDETLDSHPSCACTMVPKTKSWADILGPLGIDSSDIPETGVSSSDFQSGADWLAQQDETTQQNVLGGKAALNAYNDGAFTLDDLIGLTQSDAWGSSRYQKSLKALGIDFQDYL